MQDKIEGRHYDCLIVDDVIIQGTFSKLLAPGHRQWLSQYLNMPGETAQNLEEIYMALVNPDTSQAPAWRFPVRRMEAPITGYRVWELVCNPASWLRRSERDWMLRSVYASFVWEGPFARSDKRPLDPKHWDGTKKQLSEISRAERRHEIEHVIYTAGIHAVKNIEQIKELAVSYNAPVWGEVALWGRVAQFRLGYRAEFCMIKKLWLDVSFVTLDANEELKIADALSKRYDCEVVIV